MNIWPFKKKGTEKPGELTKEEWLRDAMPLIEVADVQDRITHYQEASDALTWSTENRTHDLIKMEPDKQVTEHRFVLDINQIDPTRQATVRNAYAMNSGLLFYYPGSDLQTKGWDLENIVGQIPVEQIGAFWLYLADSVSTYWMDYYPGKLKLVQESFWYFNIRLDNLDIYIKPLIETYVERKYANIVIPASGIPQSGNWVDDYFQVFLTGSDGIRLTGGEAIAQIADNDRLSPDGQHFRLSMFFLDEFLDDAVELPQFFAYRQRLPGITDLPTALLEEKFMAGHPLISLFTQLPIASARVDFVDQEIYSTKSVSELWLDPDSDPNGLVLQKTPSAELRAVAESMGVDLTDHGTSYFRVYNPDQLTLSLHDPSGLLTISPTQIDVTDWQPLISVAATTPLPVSTTLEVLGPTSEAIKQLKVFEFDFKLFPVSFWYLHPLNPSDYEFEEIFATINRILGRQANVFCYPAISIGNDAYNQAVHVAGIGNKNQSIYLTNETQALLQNTLAATEAEVHDINVIFTWELILPQAAARTELYLNGITIQTDENDPRPVIAVDITKNIPSVVGSTVAHEIGHWIGHFTTNNTDAEEFDHHLPGDSDSGSTSYHYNLMHLGRHSDNLFLTKRQAELINQIVSNVT
jgi:hypothetical protein